MFSAPDHPQRKLIEECPAGAVGVIDRRKDVSAASAGAILAGRLKAASAMRARPDRSASAPTTRGHRHPPT